MRSVVSYLADVLMPYLVK